MGVTKFVYNINNTCSFAERKNLKQKFKNTLHSEDHLKILAQKITFKNTRSFYKDRSPFPYSCYVVHLNIHTHTQLLCIDTWQLQLSVCARVAVPTVVLLQIKSPGMLCCNVG